jgi:hypothetical protein
MVSQLIRYEEICRAPIVFARSFAVEACKSSNANFYFDPGFSPAATLLHTRTFHLLWTRNCAEYFRVPHFQV